MPENLLTDAKVKAAKPTDRGWKLLDGGGLFLLVKQRNLEALEEHKRVKEVSFAKVAQAYLAEIKPVLALSSYRTKESRIRKYLSPKFDGMPMSDIGVKQIRP